MLNNLIIDLHSLLVQYQEEQLKVQLTQFALKKLDLVVDEFWAEISDSIQTIEVIIAASTCTSMEPTLSRWCLRMTSTQQRSANRLPLLQARFYYWLS